MKVLTDEGDVDLDLLNSRCESRLAEGDSIEYMSGVSGGWGLLPRARRSAILPSFAIAPCALYGGDIGTVYSTSDTDDLC